MRRRGPGVLLLLAALAAAGCVTTTSTTDDGDSRASAPAPDAVPVRTAGYEEVVLRFPVPACALEAALPDGYRPLLTQTGDAELVVSIGRGGAHVLADGSETVGAAVSKVAAVVEAPDGRAGTHYYLFWHVGAPSAYQSAHEAAGIAGAMLPSLAFVESAAAVGSRAAMDVAWDAAPYTVESDLPPRAPFPSDRGEHHYWHEGPRGRTVSTFHPTTREMVPVVATIEAPAGSVLAELMGRSSVPDARGVWILVDAEGTIGTPVAE